VRLDGGSLLLSLQERYPGRVSRGTTTASGTSHAPVGPRAGRGPPVRSRGSSCGSMTRAPCTHRGTARPIRAGHARSGPAGPWPGRRRGEL